MQCDVHCVLPDALLIPSESGQAERWVEISAEDRERCMTKRKRETEEKDCPALR